METMQLEQLLEILTTNVADDDDVISIASTCVSASPQCLPQSDVTATKLSIEEVCCRVLTLVVCGCV